MSLPSSTRIPDFVRSKTPKGLRLEMLKVQAKFGMHFSITNIVKDGDFWYAWFSRDLVMNDPVLDGGSDANTN